MKKKLLLAGMLTSVIILAAYFTLFDFNSNSKTYTPRNKMQSAKMQGIKGAVEYLNTIQRNQITGTLDFSDIISARKEADNISNLKAALDLQWTELGPDNIGGRTRAILIDKFNTNIIYAGGVSGGIWKSYNGGSSWVKVDDLAPNLAVSCMAQAPNGDILVGTGESFAVASGDANGSSGFIGSGIYHSSDGNVFTLIPSTTPTLTNNNVVAWAFVNELAINANGRVYAATNLGLRACDDIYATNPVWYNPVKKSNGTDYNANCSDVKIASDGTVVTSVYNLCYVSPNGDENTFVLKSSNATGGLPTSGISRIEFAFAPSNSNILYASVANNSEQLKGIYRSEDKGDTWTLIGPGGSTAFQPFGTQGSYNNVIAVDPSNQNRIFLGGIDMWEWKLNDTWTQKTLWFLEPTSSYYVHADQHAYVFHPTNPDIMYIGSDGGISRTTDGGQTFHTLNRSYNTVQFYTVGTHPYGYVAGGTQDNGTIINDFKGNQPLNGRSVMGGDGGYVGFSYINPDIMFSTVYYGDIARSTDLGKTFSLQSNSTTGDKNAFFNARMNTSTAIGENASFASFVTPFIHWENFNNSSSVDSVTFIADTNYSAGDVVTVLSKTDKYPFNYTLPYSLNIGDEIRVQDIISSRFYFGATNAVWMTKEALNFAKTPDWIKLATISGMSQSMAISKDGDNLWVGTSSGNLYRISNLHAVRDSANDDVTSPYSIVETKSISVPNSSSRAITSIAIDPQNPEHVIVTLGNYKNNVYIYRSINALDSLPTWTSKQGNLPKMPIYSAIIEMNNPNTVIVATELGVYGTDKIQLANVTWTEENAGMARVPVHMIQQQIYDYPGVANLGSIYLGTHGRGFFRSDDYVGIAENKPQDIAVAKNTLRIFPNPAITDANVFFTLSNSAKTQVLIYDLSGKLVKSNNLGLTNKGANKYNIDCSTFKSGTYIIQVISGQERITGKLVVTNY